jgi:predicted LPLAT superfamily acyltransferase
MAMSGTIPLEKRNPGPSWGYSFIQFVNQLTPWPLMQVVLRISSLVSLCIMKEQRYYSRKFLRDALGREPNWRDSWRHFTEFSEFLVRRFEVAGGKVPVFDDSDESQVELIKLADRKEQTIHSTFHFGNSDLMGFWLTKFDLSIRMVRYQVGNSNDLKWLEKRFGDKVGFLWVNRPENLLFELKGAVQDGYNIALKSDRIEHSSRLERFVFLGKERWFPFTVYYLSILFDLPVVHSFGVAVGQFKTRIYSSTIYRPTGSSKSEKLESARTHFESTLVLLERLVRDYPYQWFNFLDSNPVVSETEEILQG